VRSEVLAFHIDETTTPQFERNLPQEEATSCKTWLSLNPMETELDQNGFLNVRYTIRVPAGIAEGSYNCAAGFTTFPSSDEEQGVGMRMAVRIVAAFYVVIGKPEVSGSIKEINLEPVPASKDQDAGWQAVVVMENPGRMYYRPSGKFELLDASGKTVEADDFQPLPVLRQRSQRFLFPVKQNLDAGQYTLRARVDIGTGEVQEGTADVTIDAPAQVPVAENGKR
jgi:hypothetical protein